MGTQPPLDPTLPFGYTLDPSQQFPIFLDAPEPAPGAPLLTENDARLLNEFFEDIRAGHVPDANFGEGLQYTDEWRHLPPTFIGTATSFGQQPGLSMFSPIHGLPSDAFGEPLVSPAALMPPPPPPPPPPHHPSHFQHPSPDVVAAATALQGSSMPRPPSSGHDQHGYGRGLSMGSSVDHFYQPEHQHHQPQHHQDNGLDYRPNGVHQVQFVPDAHAHGHGQFSDMMFVGQHQQSLASPSTPGLPPLTFGSDQSFNKVGFVPQSKKETSEALENDHLRYIDCLKVSSSANTTRPSTPSASVSGGPDPQKQVMMKPDPDPPSDTPRKRRKSKAKEDARDEEPLSAVSDTPTPVAPPKTAPRKRKTKPDPATETTSPNGEGSSAGNCGPSASKRRKSTVHGATKPPRENLTDEQKRENHIRSEQKRRRFIQGGFDDLADHVPGIKEGGYSKSVMLVMTGDFLEGLLRGNEELRSFMDASGYSRE